MTLDQLEADGDAHGYLVIEEGAKLIGAFRRNGTTVAISVTNHPDKPERARRHLSHCVRASINDIEQAAA